MELSEKLRDNFDAMVVYKDLKKTNFFSTLSLPAFMRDWLLRKFEDDNGEFDKDDLVRFVKKFIPRKDDWTSIKNDIVIEGKTVKFLTKISVNIDIKTGEISFSLPDFGIGFKETIIESDVWDSCKDDLIKGSDIWGMIELGYRSPDDFDFSFEYEKKTSKAKNSKEGKIKLISFKNFSVACKIIILPQQFRSKSAVSGTSATVGRRNLKRPVVRSDGKAALSFAFNILRGIIFLYKFACIFLTLRHNSFKQIRIWLKHFRHISCKCRPVIHLNIDIKPISCTPRRTLMGIPDSL